MNDLSFLAHVDRKTDDCLRNIGSLGDTVDMLLHMSHRTTFELRKTADRLKQIIERLEARAEQIEKVKETANG